MKVRHITRQLLLLIRCLLRGGHIYGATRTKANGKRFQDCRRCFVARWVPPEENDDDG